MTDDELKILADIDGDEPSDEFVARLRARLHDELDARDDETGAPTMVSIEQQERARPTTAWIVATAAAVGAVVVGGLVVIGGDDDSSDTPAATTAATVPATTTSTSTTSTTSTTVPDPTVDVPEALAAIIAAINAGDATSAIAMIGDEAVLDGGPLGWPGYRSEIADFRAGIENLDQLDGSLTIGACSSEEPPLVTCEVVLDHVGYQALGGPADAELEVEVVEGSITYWKLSKDTRYDELRTIVVAEETAVADAVAAAQCTDWRFNREGCADMILRHLDALRAAADG